MPKKYKQKSLLTKPASSSPSTLILSRASASPNDESSTRTVNDLIRASRKENSIAIVHSVQTSASIPPPLRAVLNVPAPLPPPPRNGLRGPTRSRRIPGPPPPRSWLVDSNHAPPELRGLSWSKAHERPRIQDQSSILPGGNFPPDNSLQHVTLKHIALDWPWHAEYDHSYLAELPTRVKQTLLSYISIFNEGHGPNPFQILFPANLPMDELDEVRRLDLGNVIGGWSTLRKLEKDLETTWTRSAAERELTNASHQDEIPDAWDEDEVTQRTVTPSLATAGGVRFRNLKHLSLAVAPGLPRSTASWTGLLGIAAKISTITSLSLAYWPQPTFTPNASTGRVSIGGSGPIPRSTYGGSDYYTAFDNDWREAAGILRTLSRLLYCLKWLDLTGCGDWFPALTWKIDGGNEDGVSDLQTGPDWNGSWRALEHIVLAVGWSPGPRPLEESFQQEDHAAADLSKGLVGGSTSLTMSNRTSKLLSQLSTLRIGAREVLDPEQPEPWNVEYERAKYYYKKEVERYDRTMSNARQVIQDIRLLRKQHGGKWITAEIEPSGAL